MRRLDLSYGYPPNINQPMSKKITAAIPLYFEGRSALSITLFDKHGELSEALSEAAQLWPPIKIDEPLLLHNFAAWEDDHGDPIRITTCKGFLAAIEGVEPLNKLNRAAVIYLQHLPANWVIYVGEDEFNWEE